MFFPKEVTKEWREQESAGNGGGMAEGDVIEIKRQKNAFAREPLIPSISSMSVPIFGSSHELIGAIAVIGFTELIPATTDHELSQYLMGIQQEVSCIFGYSSEEI